jgi:hypothetical protein
VVTLVTINSEGDVTPPEMLFSQKESEVRIRPKVCRQMNDGAALIYGLKNQKQKIAKMTFK